MQFSFDAAVEDRRRLEPVLDKAALRFGTVRSGLHPSAARTRTGWPLAGPRAERRICSRCRWRIGFPQIGHSGPSDGPKVYPPKMNKLPVQSGRYPCTWDIDDLKVPGELELADGIGPQGVAFDVPGVWSADGSEPAYLTFSPHVRKIPRLRGRLRTGHDVLLLDAWLFHAHPDQSQLGARVALCGLDIPDGDGPLFDSVELQVGGLTELSSISPLRDVTLPLPSAGPGPVITASVNPEADQQWEMACGDTIALRYTTNMSFEPGYGFEVSSQPFVRVGGSPRTMDQWIQAYVRPLAEITSFATSVTQPVCWVLLTSQAERPHSLVQLFGAGITQEPYTSRRPKPTSLASLVQLGPGGASLAGLLDGWSSLSVEFDTFFNYLTVVRRDDRNWKAKFLALVPAIESYHTEKYGDGPLSRKEFQKERKAVLQRIAGAGAGEVDVQFLKDWISTIGSHPLHYRLRQLLDEDVSSELREQIRARVNPLPDHLAAVMQSPEDVWNVMGKVRNNLAHGGPRPTEQQLESLTRLADTMAVGLALRQLGVPDTSLLKAIDDDRWKVV
ncbi:ApeA N-terminal domain 1-containing protein [Kitasatospora indigofera]|uniref:ApeA N-terminal domain 1-containing protein n=1 Tax=Kitasatospora indigofera TaxID=67307 RepID=UPI0036C19BEE